MGSMEAGGRSNHFEEEDGGRQGTVWSATAHCVTAIIGSGVLALAWSVAQLGWIFGPISLVAFAAITYYTSALLADCYRYPDPINGTRNPNYMSCVRSYLGPRNVLLCCIAQYTNLWGLMISYTITTATSMSGIMRSNCLHTHGNKDCSTASENLSMTVFGAISILVSLFPNIGEITWLSVLAAVMSFGYSSIGLCLCLAKWISHGGHIRGSLIGVMSTDISPASKTWTSFQALGNIAFAYSYSAVLIEIQDTLKAPPSENVTMRKAGLYGISITTMFYVTIGCIGYAAFGNDSPGNILAAFNEPFWLVDIANLFILVHLVGSYQVVAQPVFVVLEKTIASKWPNAPFLQTVYIVKVPFTQGKLIAFTPARILIRGGLVVITTLVSMFFPFFNAIIGWIGAWGFWPLTVYFPVKMYLCQKKIKQGAGIWYLLHGMSFVSLVVCVAAIIGSTAGIIHSLQHTNLFHMLL